MSPVRRAGKPRPTIGLPWHVVSHIRQGIPTDGVRAVSRADHLARHLHAVAILVLEPSDTVVSMADQWEMQRSLP